MKKVNRALTVKEMKREAAKLKKQGKKIVFTNGCFDLLHVGHTSLFEKAAELGDVLIVAILALKPVDYVVVFGQDTPEKILKELMPDVLVKGGDYKLKDIIGREYAKRVYRYPFVTGRSTTNLINLIVERYGKANKKNHKSR